MATETQSYDAVIIGSGQAAKPLGIALAKAGWKTSIIERALVGGTCINYGCTPTKTMVASGRVAYLARRGADYGVRTGEISVDLAKVRERKRAIVESFRSGGQRAIEQTENLDLLFGEASFSGPTTISVKLNDGGQRVVTAPKIFIHAGCRPARLEIEGIENVAVLDSTSIMELDRTPDHLIVVGGGYIGLEFGQMFRRFGGRVTIIQRAERLLAREDPDVADEVVKILREDGIEVLLNASPVRVEQTSEGIIKLSVHTPAGEQVVEGSHLLAAAGRVPNTDTLNLSAAGVAADKHGFVKVNEKLETNVPGVYALGDIKGGPQFTHISYDDFRILRTNLLEGGSASIKDRLVPYTVFIDPQLGRVGLTETDAVAAGRRIKIAKMPMAYVARALEMDESRGFMKVVVDEETSQILGCSILGIEGGEIMSMIQIAMMGRLPYTVLKDAVFAHPTLSESLNTLFSL
jgi:pyruvate/2-oxoglutarate dehydrogenase complex dihydrolipoamide dehydrogenase (E3) component